MTSTLKVSQDYHFPATSHSNRNYYVGHQHISGRFGCFYYSPRLQGLLCLPCVLFAPNQVGRSQVDIGRLVSQPMCSFRKLTGKDGCPDKHLTRDYHEDAARSMDCLSQTASGGDISTHLKTQQAEQRSRNRAILHAVILEIEACGRLNLALRGHRDAGPLDVDVTAETVDYTQGIFRALLQKSALSNPVLANHLKLGPKNASYISAETQNHLISSISTVLIQSISSEIQAAKFYAIQADETSDVSKMEQLTVVIRYIDSNSAICENFVGFIEVDQVTGAAISETILSLVRRLGLNTDYMVAQSYDGASNMSGPYNGVQAIIRAHCPHAMYVHCFSHCLNLVLSKVSGIPEITSVLTAVKSACHYFKNAPQRVKRLQGAIDELCHNTRHTRLKQYCATRWVERHDYISIFLELYLPLLSVFNRDKELSLAKLITDSEFLVCCYILNGTLGLTKDLSVTLQSKQHNILSAMAEIDSALETLKAWRVDEQDVAYSSIFHNAELKYAAVESTPDCKIPMPRLAGRQQHRANVAAGSPEEYYKRAVWYHFLDSIISEMGDRFNKHSKTAMAMASIIPVNCSSASFEDIGKFAQLFGSLLPDGLDACRAEYERWKRRWQRQCVPDRPTTLSDTLRMCDPSIYPNISDLLRIYSTIPVTTATAERSFSQLRLLKTYLRSTMKEDRLNGLALLAVHKEISLKYDDVIDHYALGHNHRLNFV